MESEPKLSTIRTVFQRANIRSAEKLARRIRSEIDKYEAELLADGSIPAEVVRAHCHRLAITNAAILINRKAPRHFDRVATELARRGETEAARSVLEIFVHDVEASRSKDPKIDIHVARYLADAFREILNGKDASLALGIKSSRAGRRKGVVTHNPLQLAAAHFLLIRSGLTKKQAREALQDITGADEKTIRTAVQEDKRLAYPQLAEERTLLRLAGPLAEKIGPILTRSSKR